MAQRYVFPEAASGPCYEASLPGRRAFCIRDMAHQSTGAQILGLSKFSKNMILRFAENIAESRQWCTFWEITQDNLPAPEDYQDDDHFWYNLPANFDLVDCCYRQYRWTGDRDFILHPILKRFYDKSVNDYVRAWDRDHDGVLEHYPKDGHRGIASYNEQLGDPLMGGDMVAAQYAGFYAAAALRTLIGDASTSASLTATAIKIRQRYNSTWWNEDRKTFYGMRDQSGDWVDRYTYEGNFLPLYFGIVDPGIKTDSAVHELMQHGAPNVEGLTYLVDILYRYGQPEAAYALWTSFPERPRREYPEVAFSMIGAVVSGMAGMNPDATSWTIATKSRLNNSTAWLEIADIPVFDGTCDIKHIGNSESRFTNHTSRTVCWRATFPGEFPKLRVDGDAYSADTAVDDPSGQVETYREILVEPGQSCVASRR